MIDIALTNILAANDESFLENYYLTVLWTGALAVMHVTLTDILCPREVFLEDNLDRGPGRCPSKCSLETDSTQVFLEGDTREAFL